MKTIKLCLFFLFFYFSSARAEEISIGLKAQTSLSPLCLTFQDQGFHSQSYVKELYDSLIFDFNHTGFTNVTIIEGRREYAFWKTIGASYAVFANLTKNSLELELLNVKANEFCTYSISLEKKAALDCQKIHEITSQITQDLFGVKGIQDKKLIYSLRSKDLNDSSWISEIWVCDYDGKNTRQLTHNSKYATCPRFIPHDKAFLYVDDFYGQPKILKADFNNTKGDTFIQLRGSQALPAISFAANLVSFISDAAGRPDLFLQILDKDKMPLNKPLQLFSSPRATQAASTFSPDGKRIAFVSDKDGPPRIYILEIPNTHTFKTPKCTLITKKNRQNTSPSWSPDGTKLAYSAKTDGIRQIWIYDFEQDEEWQLTIGNNNMENPMWAPDSLHLIFNSEDAFASELYLMNIHQKNPTRISNGPGDKRFPAWEF